MLGESVKICSKIYGGKYPEQTKGSPTFLMLKAIIPMPRLRLLFGMIRTQFK